MGVLVSKVFPLWGDNCISTNITGGEDGAPVDHRQMSMLVGNKFKFYYSSVEIIFKIIFNNF